MYILKYQIFGRAHGNFHPTSQPRKEFLNTLIRTKETHLPSGIQWIFSPSVKFTNRVTGLNVHNDIWTTGADYHPSVGFVRTRIQADGGVVLGPLTGIAMFNGDCPIVCLRQDNQLAVLHAGYRCLVRAEPSEQNIIESGMASGIVPFDTERTQAWVWGGIGPCCWVPEENKPEVRDLRLAGRNAEILERCLGRTTYSPLGPGKVSVDLYQLAYLLLRRVGVPEKNISWDTTCTCCATENGQPKYWSHTRFQAKQQDVDGRNMSIAWLETSDIPAATSDGSANESPGSPRVAHVGGDSVTE